MARSGDVFWLNQLNAELTKCCKLESKYPAIELVIALTTSSFLFFSASFFVLRTVTRKSSLYAYYKPLSKTQQFEWDTRMVSNLNAILCAIIAGYAIFVQLNDLLSGPYTYNSMLNIATLCTLNGYLLYDAMLTLVFGDSDLSTTIQTLTHHFAGMSALSVSAVAGYVQLFALCFVFTEISTPFVNFRWMLDVSGFRERTVYFLNGVVMIIVFFVARLVPIPWLLYEMYIDHVSTLLELDYLVMGLAIMVPAVMNTLNMFWFIKMCKGALKMLSSPSGAKTATVPRTRSWSGDTKVKHQ